MAEPVTQSPVTQSRVIRAEWIKLRSVRSSWFMLAVTALSIVGIGLLVSYVNHAHWSTMSAGDRAGIDPVITFAGGEAMSDGHRVALGSAEAVRVVLGAALYLTVVGVMGVGLGFLIRSTAGAIATLLGVLLILPLVVAALPARFIAPVVRYLPSTAGRALFTTNGGDLLAPWPGFGIFLVYALVVLAAAAAVVRWRDV
jgi:hypothetical protein